jgi:hypothetical protein
MLASATILQEQICKGVPQPSRADEIIRVAIAITVLTYFVFTLRVISRYMVCRRIWWDDWCLIAAVVSLNLEGSYRAVLKLRIRFAQFP